MADEDITWRLRVLGARKAQRDLEAVKDEEQQLERAHTGLARSTAALGREADKIKPKLRAMGVAVKVPNFAKQAGTAGQSRRVMGMDIWPDAQGRWRVGGGPQGGQFASNRILQAAGLPTASVKSFTKATKEAGTAVHRTEEELSHLGRTDRALHSGFLKLSRVFNRNVRPSFRQFTKDIAGARVSLGFMSVSLRSVVILIGASANQISALTGPVLGFIEGISTAALGLGAAGAIGMSALAQGAGVAALAFNNLGKAWNGDDKALQKLAPAQQKFITQLEMMRPTLERFRQIAGENLFRGITQGLVNARPLLGVLRPIVAGTASTLGNVAQRGLSALSTPEWMKDIRTLGHGNIAILRSLGNAALNFADALRNILLPAVPLAKWLARQIEMGAHLTAVWAHNERAAGRMSRFWDRARVSLAQVWSIMKHFTRGILNLFGAHDVDGTKTLASLDRIMARFERWTRSPEVQKGLGQAIENQMGILVARLSEMVARGFVKGLVQGVRLLGIAFMNSDLVGKALIGGILLLRFGALSVVGSLMGKAISVGLKLWIKRNLGLVLTGTIEDALVDGTVLSALRGIGSRWALAISGGLAFSLALAVQELADKLTPKPVKKAFERSREASKRGDPLLRIPGISFGLPEAIDDFKHGLGTLGKAVGIGGPEDAGAAVRRRRHTNTIRTSLPPIHVHAHFDGREAATVVGRQVQRDKERR